MTVIYVTTGKKYSIAMASVVGLSMTNHTSTDGEHCYLQQHFESVDVTMTFLLLHGFFVSWDGLRVVYTVTSIRGNKSAARRVLVALPARSTCLVCKAFSLVNVEQRSPFHQVHLRPSTLVPSQGIPRRSCHPPDQCLPKCQVDSRGVVGSFPQA